MPGQRDVVTGFRDTLSRSLAVSLPRQEIVRKILSDDFCQLPPSGRGLFRVDPKMLRTGPLRAVFHSLKSSQTPVRS